MDTGKCICLCICVVLQVITVESVQILEMSGSTNCGSTYYIRDVDDDGFLISWLGQTINNECELYIKAKNEIKPCVALVTYAMPDCAPKISVYDGSQIDHNQMRYVNCYSRVLQMCGSYEGTLTMKFTDFTSVSNSNVTLKVYGEVKKDEDDGDFNYHLIQPIATAAGVVLVVVATAIGWCVMLKISRKRERERKARMAANPPMSWAQQAQAAQTQAQYNQGFTYNTNQNTMYPTATSNPVEKVQLQ
ncbi:uncharacterized protein [Argopecten irradians]|uniref:uncharacterized protein n=1 Tax=Argopecten irradians TaxID=31199 RepID=UPI003710A7BF